MRIPEFLGLALSWFVITLCFSIRTLFYPFSPELFAYVFLFSGTSAGLGFLLHELAHRSAARRYGCYAYYNVWLLGIILALIMAVITRGSVIFAALGAVYIVPMMTAPSLDIGAMKKAYGIISLSGPSMNLLLAAFFYALSFLGGIFAPLGAYGIRINLWLAAFNLIPIPPFDGYKVFSWSKVAWALFAVPSWALVLIL
ncbi:MAG: hypothetical protein QFX35_04440 [Candidatus Verstraetearchaeota archaeon]|nr:hypothetical protein [Candidatus Verstraetearchaeota archaeon]